MRFTCEVIASDVFPGLRSIVASELVNKFNMSQMDVASVLGISQPAVSQYVRSLRGYNKKLLEHEKIMPEIRVLCEEISRNKDSIQAKKGFMRICKLIIDNNLIAELYKDVSDDGCHAFQ